MAARTIEFSNAFSELAALATGTLEKHWRYIVYYGGRGSGKSMSIAIALVMLAATSRKRILCARELQNSITESVHKLVCDVIEMYGLQSEFVITNTSIRSKTGSEFIFKGLRHSVAEIKSMQGVDICWVEEAQAVPAASWKVLIPTLREHGSMFLISFNPDQESDDTYQRFVVKPDLRRTYVRKVNFDENDWFPDELRDEMEHLRATDYEEYLNVWEGFPKKVSDALIFKGKFRIEAFDTPAKVDRFYFGADWGFVDPTVLVRSFVVGNTLYIDHEAQGPGVTLRDTPALFLKVPEAGRWLIMADNARPETITHMVAAGFLIKASKKGKGSIMDGIEHLRSFDEIVIHPRCELTAKNFSNYSYKVDKITKEILNKDPEDKHCDAIDALRYGLEPLMRRKRGIRQVSNRLMER